MSGSWRIFRALGIDVYINGLLFLFKMMPAYPLDGGQILQAILWYFMPRLRAITYSSAVGLVFAG